MVNTFSSGLALAGWMVAVSGLWDGGGRVCRANWRAGPISTRPFPACSMIAQSSPSVSSIQSQIGGVEVRIRGVQAQIAEVVESVKAVQSQIVDVAAKIEVTKWHTQPNMHKTWASKYMEWLAAAIVDRRTTDVYEELNRIITY